MISFDDFGTTRDAYRNYLAQKAYLAGGAYTLSSFERLALGYERSRVKLAVRKATNQKLKILLHGHGDGIHDVITNDAGTERRDQDTLVTLLGGLLQGRANAPVNAPNTIVRMVSCLYGRAQQRDLKQSNAWKLHRKLALQGIRVELHARTELVLQTGAGIQTSSYTRHQMGSPVSGHRKAAFAKVRCYYDPSAVLAATIALVDSTNGRTLSDTAYRTRQEVWALYAMDTLISHSSKHGSNANHLRIRRMLEAYDTVLELRPTYRQDPPLLKGMLEYLIGRKSSPPIPTGFGRSTPLFVITRLEPIRHRSLGFFGYHSSAPKTTQEITRLLALAP